MSDKYPRTFHLPWSEGASNDDKKLSSISQFLSTKENLIEIVITEKLDGSNSCLKKEGVFARSHNVVAAHESFNLLKAKYYEINHLLKDDERVFGENCFAIHSIEYPSLPVSFFVFGVFQNNWLSYDDVKSRAYELGLTMTPELFRGYLFSEKEFQKICEQIMNSDSVFGGDREGLVIRVTKSFTDKEFSTLMAKQVRKDHVQTSDHWMFQKVRPQKLSKK